MGLDEQGVQKIIKGKIHGSMDMDGIGTVQSIRRPKPLNDQFQIYFIQNIDIPVIPVRYYTGIFIGKLIRSKNVGFLGTRFSDPHQMVSNKAPHQGKILDQKFSFRSCGYQEGYVEC